ncbi:MAG: carboxymuconolactone decarboxylase family protein [Planctomycetota bacterium]|jgi:alkylhydroperoxidase family enzyme
MARLPFLDRDDVDASVQPTFDAFLKSRGNVPHLFRVLARRPGMVRATAGLLREATADGEVSVRLKELIALRVSHANECDY